MNPADRPPLWLKPNLKPRRAAFWLLLLWSPLVPNETSGCERPVVAPVPAPGAPRPARRGFAAVLTWS